MHMAKRPLLIMLFLLGTAGLSAQVTFTAHLTAEREGQGRVRLHQASDLEKRVNGQAEKKTETAAVPAPPATKNTQPADAVPASPVAKKEADSTTHVEATRTTVRKQKATGYRIQIFTGGNSRADRQAAEQSGRTCREAFPELTAYTHFLSPRWVCRVGDFATQQEAAEYAAKIREKNLFREVSIVKSVVWLPEK